MSITVLTKDFVRALDIATRASTTKSTLPVLAGVLLDFQGADELLVSATNLEIGLRVTLPVTRGLDFEPFQAVPQARLLLDYVKSVQADSIRLTYEMRKNVKLGTESGTLTLQAGRTKTEFECIPGEDFPSLPNLTTMTTTLQLSSTTLKELITNTAYAASVEASRPILTGVNVAVRDGLVHFAATDGFRLGYAARNGQVGDLKHALTIPAKALTNLNRLLDAETETPVTLYLADNRNSVGFTVGDVYLVSQLVEGQFPDYRLIFPKASNTRIIVQRNLLIGAIRQAHLFAQDDNSTVRLNLTPGVDENLGVILVSGESKAFGKTEAAVEAVIKGSPLLIAVNAKYALHALATIKTTKVLIELGTSVSPLVFKPVMEEEGTSVLDLHLAMPMHIAR
jgi:DNA polymerase-3 subunit beta